MADPWSAFPDAPQKAQSDPWSAFPDAPKKEVAWADVPGQALKNLPKSALEFGKAVIQPILHPVDTGKALLSLGDAIGSKISRPGELLRVGDAAPTQQELTARATREAPADALGQFLKDRYGGADAIKNTLATDPVGSAADLASVLTGTGAALRAPMLTRAGALIDPLTQTGNAIKYTGKGIEAAASHGLGMTTGAGADSIRLAANAGREGGEVGEVFRANMRGAPVEGVVERAKGALDQVRKERGDAYNAGKVDLSKDRTVLDFNAIDNSIGKASEVGTFKGVTTEPAAVATVDSMRKQIDDWKKLDPAEYHTPEGLDALKRSLGNLRDATVPRTPERIAADRIYRAVRDEVAAQAPAYSKMMEDYGTASDKINEVTKALSLGEKASGDTTARKLLSATRNNVQTNYGGRQKMIDLLAEKDPTLPAAIAGQALNSAMPRGLVARLSGMAAAPAAAAASLANPGTILGAPLLAAFSPRAMGEVAHAGGRAAGGASALADALAINAPNVRGAGQVAFQAGREDSPEMRRKLAQLLMRANEARQ